MDADLKKLKMKLEEMERNANMLMEEIETIDKYVDQSRVSHLSDLREENEKMKYRILHLEKAIELENKHSNDKSVMLSFRAMLADLFERAILAAFPTVANHEVLLSQGSKPTFGDYQMNSAMGLSKILKNQGINVTPGDVASKILEKVEKCRLMERCEIAGPGFVNVFLNKEFVANEIISLLKVPDVLPPSVGHKKRVVVDYSSPNIAKEMHVGHLRSTIIGDAVANLCEFLGHDVLRLNHVGDWGTQFGMLIAHLQDRFPTYKRESPNIADLQSFYKESKQRFDTDDFFKKRAYDAVVKLQSHDVEYLHAWNLICDVSRKEFSKIYSRLGISNLKERGESFYQSRMKDIVDLCKSKNLLHEDEGRFILWPRDCEIPLTIVKSDGGYTYDTSDLAAIKQRIDEELANWIIYVVDSGQSVHFKGIFRAAEMAGITKPELHRIDHVGFGVVLGEDRKKFKTRSGETVRLVDLLDEGMKRSLKVLIDKERDKELSELELTDAKEAVAYGCIKYADLCHTRTNDYIFSFDKMLDDKGNTAVYLLYAYVRIVSIIRKTGLTEINLLTSLEGDCIKLNHEKEWKLAKAVLRFPDVILNIERDLMLHKLCDYLYDLSGTFTEFYDACKCMEINKLTNTVESINMERILLCQATAKVIKKSFDILGLKALERM